MPFVLAVSRRLLWGPGPDKPRQGRRECTTEIRVRRGPGCVETDMTIPNITEDELGELERCASSEEWNAACDSIKRRRGGQYPTDWWPRVMKSGLAARVMRKFGTHPSITVGTIKVR